MDQGGKTSIRKSKAKKAHDEIDEMEEEIVNTRLLSQPSILKGDMRYY